MTDIRIPEEQIVSMDEVAPGVRGLRLAFVNIFAVSRPDGSWTLIDAALPYTAEIIKSWAERHFVRPPDAIVLTHGHFDHVSAAAELARSWDLPIYAHPLEFPYLTGQREYPEPNVGAGGGLMSMLSPLYPRGPVNLGERLRELPVQGADIDFPQLPEWRVIHTPGHTAGHVSLFRAEDRTLVVGDAFCTTKPESFFEAAVVQQPELHGPPAYFTSDWEQAGISVRMLAELNPAIVAPGHGKPLAGERVAAGLHELAEEFGEVAVRENEKHVA